MDVDGKYGGLLFAWNPKIYNLSLFIYCTRILLVGHLRDLDQTLKIVNCYGSYVGIHEILGEVVNSGLMKESSLILGGDLNLTTSTREIWGFHTRLDPLFRLFNHIFQNANLIYVVPLPLVPMWRNERTCATRVAK